MSNQTLISVVIPAFDRANIIEECIKSVLGQTHKELEVIVVDDHSNDNTPDIVDAISEWDSRVRPCVRCNENHGACYARNLGASLARGEYIAFQDSDDMWRPKKLERQLAYMKKGKYDLVFCGMERINDIRKTRWYFPRYTYREDKPAKEQILYENPMSTQCIMLKRSVFDRIRFDENIRKFQDWDFAIRAADHAKIGYLREALVDSTVQTNSISQNVSRYDALWVIYNKYKDLVTANRRIDARFFMKAADELAYNNQARNGIPLYKESLKRSFRVKTFIKFLRCVVLSVFEIE